MTGDPDWRALYLEFLAHAARNAGFRCELASCTKDMRSALETVVTDRA